MLKFIQIIKKIGYSGSVLPLGIVLNHRIKATLLKYYAVTLVK